MDFSIKQSHIANYRLLAIHSNTKYKNVSIATYATIYIMYVIYIYIYIYNIYIYIYI